MIDNQDEFLKKDGEVNPEPPEETGPETGNSAEGGDSWPTFQYVALDGESPIY